MSIRPFLPVALGIAFCVPALLRAQTPLVASPAPSDNPGVQVGGKLAVDLLTVQQDSLGVPLRHGSVLNGTEEVRMEGRKLQPGQDYTIDNDAGMVYLMVPSKPGDTVSVSYRYNPAGAQSSTGVASNAFTPFRMNFGAGNSVGLMLGMGMAERDADGSVLSTNMMGWSNSFSAGSSKLNGLMLFGNAAQRNPVSQFGYQAPTNSANKGASRLLLQSLSGDAAGGKYQIDFQDVSKNFSGFSGVTANGYDQSVATQLNKEKGLRRMGVSMDGLKFGGLGLTESYKTVGDEKGGITWENYGLNVGGLSLNFKSQDVGQKFDRFNDIAESDRAQLAKEAGLRRQSLDGMYKLGFGSLSYNSSNILDQAGKGITKTDLKFDSKILQFDSGSQEVQTGFTRFDSLSDADHAQWAKETGLRRNWTNLNALVFGANAQPLKFAQYKIDSPTGEMADVDASAGTKTWSFEHIERKVDSGFTALPNLTQQEINANIGAIASMYAPGGLPLKPEYQNAYLQSAGLDRNFTRLTVSPAGGWTLGFDTLSLKGKKDSSDLSHITLTGKGISVAYKQQDVGKNFTQLSSLLPFEQQQLGSLTGINRTDLNVNAELPGKSKLSFGDTNASSPTGGFKRETMSYSNSAMQLTVNQRKVDPGFTAAGQVLDAEAGLLASMIGFGETDAQLKWQISSALHLEASVWNGTNTAQNQRKAASNVLVDWSPDKATALHYQRVATNSDDPLTTLLFNAIQTMSLTQKVGKNGTLKFSQQDISYNGTQANQPDSKQTDVSYETKLTDTTSVKTEQIDTTYGNGDKEQDLANTVDTSLTKQAGLQLSDISIDRAGTANDERKQNVGFWIKLWNGVKLNFGVVDDLNNNGNTTTQHTVSLTPGSMGNWQIGSANYTANTWDQTNRIQAASTVSINTVKPFTLGFFKDVTLKLGQDTAADNGAWLKDNKVMNFSSKIGKNAIGYNYQSQLTGAGQRGVDRTFTFTTDQSQTSRFRANLFYKFRSLPGAPDVAIRNFSITARPVKAMEITNELSTNPEIPRSDVLLGSLPQPLRVNKWKLDYNRDPNFKIEGSWEEQRNDQTNALSRLSGVTFTLFEKTGSPVSLFLGNELASGNVPTHAVDRWSLRWDQRPGPNQSLSLFLGNVTYGGTISPGDKRHNLSVDCEYQWRFGGPNKTSGDDNNG